MSTPEAMYYREHPLPQPENTWSEENKTVVVVPLCLSLDPSHPSKSGGVRRSSCSCRRKKGASSTCGGISRLLHGVLGSIYVFHAPDANITPSRSSAEAASVRCFLCRT